MRLTDASIAIRPRPAWEALDLGVLLAGRHRSLLMLSWALVTLPILGVLSLVLWDYPSVVIALFWWFKPLYERLPLWILSRALFGATPTLKQALKAWPGLLKRELLPSLLWRRLSLLRSFTLPVQQLEGLSGQARRLRLAVLCQADTRAARCLTLAGAHLELVLYTAAIMLVYVFMPRQMDVDWSWLLILGSDDQLLWVDHLLNLLYAVALIAWGPVYVSCGFMLYLNRRTRLEAWDIELVFKRLRQRLAGSAATLVVGALLLLGALPHSGWAYASPAPESVQPSPQSTRLTHQPLNSQQSHAAITDLLEKPPFKNPETVTGWRLPEAQEQPPTAGQAPSTWFDWLNHLLKGANVLAHLFEILLWSLAIGLLGLVIWRYRQWLRLFIASPGRDKPVTAHPPAQLFGLQVSAQSLPDDIAGTVLALWPDQPREALSLLYRALLSHLITDYQLPLKSADTEQQALQRIASLNKPALSDFSHELTGHWQNLAYGHRLPAAHVLPELCERWRSLFETGARP
ncbi:DUF4129 domain-containing protein [Pseudomonas sp. LJDD11]|uniref:DUF4129 domain-containing protein n=1 Tax=Pseudomonas sp. LJDD11 TaxID=2931984 RepID=UPI00211B92AF|nr:DUF4129 domain-containing protein [Pseudomonas sp. LJDD11]MCQ9422456.1 DUF4129 domain-containing protein [Pseudomonas sp. LJDD11]